MDWWTQSAVQKIVMASTGSGTYSNRLWTIIDALKSRLETTLAQVLIGGQNPRKAAQQLRVVVQKDVGNIKHITERIARTESARCQTQATLESFNHYGVEWCQWTAEPNACPACAEYARHNDGVYRVKDVPTLPAHPNCRCALAAYWKDNILTTDMYMNTIPIRYQSNEKMPVKTFPNFVSARYIGGKVVQYRLYDKEGYALVDFDLTNHGNPKHHTTVPHKHEWTVIKTKNGVKYKRSKYPNIPLTDEELELVKRWREYDN